MGTLVQKYGGSSVADIEKIRNVANRLIDRKEKGDRVVVVVSAMGKTTNALLDLASQVSKTPSKREMDMLLSTGEQVTISLLAMMLIELGHDAVALTGKQAGIVTEGPHMKSKISDIDIDTVQGHLDEGKIVVVAGFQGANEAGEITTLGRGGSDTSAVALAAKLGCPCEIYTDVDGIYGIDPRLYPAAKKLDQISYEEMMEMANLGAKVMEPRSVEIAARYNVPLYVGLSTGSVAGTQIKEYDESMEQKSVTGISATDNILMITLNNLPNGQNNTAKIFTELAAENVNIDMISQSSPMNGNITISFTAPKDDEGLIDKVVTKAQGEIGQFDYNKSKDVVKVSVIGNGMRTQSGVAAKIFKLFSDNDIEFLQVTTSEISISYTIKASDKDKTVSVLASELGL